MDVSPAYGLGKDGSIISMTYVVSILVQILNLMFVNDRNISLSWNAFFANLILDLICFL